MPNSPITSSSVLVQYNDRKKPSQITESESETTNLTITVQQVRNSITQESEGHKHGVTTVKATDQGKRKAWHEITHS